MKLQRGIEIGGLNGQRRQPAQRVHGFRIGVQHLLVQPLGVVALAQSAVGQRQVGVRFGPLRAILQAAFERLRGAAVVFALQPQVAQAEARFFLLGSPFQHLFVVALGFFQLAGVLQAAARGSRAAPARPVSAFMARS